jgi:hypothetical protein
MRPIALALLTAVVCANVFATDHNEPDLLNSFYRDRDGSGADIYHIFAYPNKSGDKLNLILTLAPVPETGKFDPESVQRIYLCPAARPALTKTEDELIQGMAEEKSFVQKFKKYKKEVLDPIVEGVGPILIGRDVNSLPIDQAMCPEIMAEYSRNGLRARITFKNFHFDRGGTQEQTVVESNGAQSEVDTKKIRHVQGIDVFVGGRDDAFFVDLGGFFRSMNWASALDKDREFIWEGGISYLDSSAKKESYSRAKRLLDREKSEIVYNGVDSRAGNNINALAFSIPLRRLTDDTKRNRILRVWAESFLTENAYNKIAPQQGENHD